MNKLLYLFVFSLCFSLNADNKILIITHVHSRPDFIELHAKTFNAFLQEEYEYVVFNDGPTDEMRIKIEEACQRLNIRCLRIPQELHEGRKTPSKRHIDAIQYSLNKLGFDHDGIVLMIDSDMFLIKPLSIISFMQNYNFIGDYQSRSDGLRHVVYTSPALVFMDMRTLPNKKMMSFEDGIIEGFSCDTGGSMYYYFKNNPSVNLKYYYTDSTDLLPKNSFQLKALGHDEGSINFILSIPEGYGVEFHGGTSFLHYYSGGSNWVGYGPDYNKEKTKMIKNYIDTQIAAYTKE